VGELFNVSEQLQHKVIFIYFMSNVGGGGGGGVLQAPGFFSFGGKSLF